MLRYYDGGSPSDLWAVRSAGIDAATGREIFLHKDGTQSFAYNVEDEVVVGNSDPKLEGVVGMSFTIKVFRLLPISVTGWVGRSLWRPCTIR